MKTKPIIIFASVFVVLASAVLFILYGKGANKNGDEEGVRQFLTSFTNYAASGQTDSLLNCFEADMNNDAVARMVNLLAGKSGVNGKSAPLADLSFNLDESVIESLTNGTISATIPVFLNHDKLETRRSVLILKISKSKEGTYKIIQADARQFFTDFIAYENFVRSKTLRDEDIYDPRTIAAFANANKLKTRFDSVIWFSHIADKTYYYVVKGEWEENAMFDATEKKYNMGLIGPGLNVIVPVEFDVVGQIGATFPEMIEVQKNEKRGFYDLNGNVVVPINYDQVFPLDGEGDNIAALRIGDDFYWLKSNYTVSDKTEIHIADILPKLKKIGSFMMNSGDYRNIIEFNSREHHGSIYLPPSYMTDFNLLPVFKTFKNPLRRKVEYYDVSDNYVVNKNFIKSKQDDSEGKSWWQSAFYTIRDYYLGGREEFYDRNNMVIVDKQRNRIYSTNLSNENGELGFGFIENSCTVSNIKALNDSLFEVKMGSSFYLNMYDSTEVLTEAPYYYYLAIKNNKLIQLNTDRSFTFTKFIKMDDSYLDGCYVMDIYKQGTKRSSSKRIDHTNEDILRYIKNEIYADHGYEFKDKRWVEILGNFYEHDDYKPIFNKNALDSLTSIDKYNINFIDQKLKGKKTTTLAAK